LRNKHKNINKNNNNKMKIRITPSKINSNIKNGRKYKNHKNVLVSI